MCHVHNSHSTHFTFQQRCAPLWSTYLDLYGLFSHGYSLTGVWTMSEFLDSSRKQLSSSNGTQRPIFGLCPDWILVNAFMQNGWTFGLIIFTRWSQSLLRHQESWRVTPSADAEYNTHSTQTLKRVRYRDLEIGRIGDGVTYSNPVLNILIAITRKRDSFIMGLDFSICQILNENCIS